MNAADLLTRLNQAPDEIQFKDVIAAIEHDYRYTPTRFRNGNLLNNPGENEGSCKVFAFAHLAGLEPKQTLQLFAEHFRSVVNTPEGIDHQNIRNFMATGWQGLQFESIPLARK